MNLGTAHGKIKEWFKDIGYDDNNNNNKQHAVFIKKASSPAECLAKGFIQ